MLQLEVLIGELGAVDGLASSAIVVGEVATLDLKKSLKRRKNSLRVQYHKKDFFRLKSSAWCTKPRKMVE